MLKALVITAAILSSTALLSACTKGYGACQNLVERHGGSAQEISGALERLEEIPEPEWQENFQSMWQTYRTGWRIEMPNSVLYFFASPYECRGTLVAL